jgi:hypothetical protein
MYVAGAEMRCACLTVLYAEADRPGNLPAGSKSFSNIHFCNFGHAENYIVI